MNFNFLKTPSTIAALLIVVLYFLPMTPYFKNVVETGTDDKKEYETKSITGLGMLTGSVKQSSTSDKFEEPSSDLTKKVNEETSGVQGKSKGGLVRFKKQYQMHSGKF